MRTATEQDRKNLLDHLRVAHREVNFAIAYTLLRTRWEEHQSKLESIRTDLTTIIEKEQK